MKEAKELKLRIGIVLTFLLLAETVGFTSKASAEPIDDAMDICTRLADDTLGRIKEFEALGWEQTTDMDGAARAMADTNAILRPPSENTEEAWKKIFTSQEELNEHLNWPYILEFGGSYVFLDDFEPRGFESHATCAFAAAASSRSVDLYLEAGALGNIVEQSGVYRGRISRMTRYDDVNGWITVIVLAGIGSEPKMPQRFEASTRLTFVNGPLRE